MSVLVSTRWPRESRRTPDLWSKATCAPKPELRELDRTCRAGSFLKAMTWGEAAGSWPMGPGRVQMGPGCPKVALVPRAVPPSLTGWASCLAPGSDPCHPQQTVTSASEVTRLAPLLHICAVTCPGRVRTVATAARGRLPSGWASGWVEKNMSAGAWARAGTFCSVPGQSCRHPAFGTWSPASRCP